MSITSTRWNQIASSLQDKEYRDSFAIEHIEAGIPFQIRAMREARGWSQEELAARMGMMQTAISRLENPDYGRFSLATLKRLASAFDVALVVRFVPFSQLVDWAANLSPENLAVPDYEHDPRLSPASDTDATADHNGHGESGLGDTIPSHGIQVSQGEHVVRVNNLSYLRDHRNGLSMGSTGSPILRGVM